ncbi:MAG: F0F1 ATP synthase subunit A [Christensenellaceae bacterium]|nr:F0F1 ATP synthase subunit A [Christensenellaceae bacterium]
MYSLLSGKFIDFWKSQYEEAFGGGMREAVQEAINPEKVNFLGLQANPAIYSALIASGLIIAFAIIVRIFVIPRFKKNPKGLQLILESFTTYFDRSATSSLEEKHGSFVGPYIFTMATFIAVGTLIEVLGFRPAFASINSSFACGVSTFLIINICGFREKKLHRIRRYVPNVMNIMSDLAVPLSLSLRLFGSIMSGFIIIELLYTSIFMSFAIPAVVTIITTFFHAALQSYLFASLSVIFVKEAIE